MSASKAASYARRGRAQNRSVRAVCAGEYFCNHKPTTTLGCKTTRSSASGVRRECHHQPLASTVWAAIDHDMTQIPYHSKKMQRQRYRLIILFALGLLCASCTTESKARFTIVATTSMLGDAVKNIVQDHARVVTLMGPGVDPHAYKATQQDVSHLMQADIIFFNGLHLEGKMAEILQKLRKRRPVYAASDALTEIQLLIDSHFPYGIDPHIWFDVSLWQQVVQHLSQQLQAADPALAAQYQANTAQYLQQLATLHTATQQAIQQIPAPQRVLITAHDAFGYFGRAYGLKVRGLQGLSTVSECGLKDVTELVKFIIQRNIKALFLETSVPDRPLKAVVEGCQQRGHPVAIGGYLYSDALGQAETPAGTYCGMVQANTQKIVEALR